jgi:hypothetical protein
MRKLRIPIYGGDLIICGSIAEFDVAYAKRFERDQPTPRRSGICGMTASGVAGGETLIVTGVWDKSGSTRCHEAVHCAQAVAEHSGMDPLREEEAFAYLVQWFWEVLA